MMATKGYASKTTADAGASSATASKSEYLKKGYSAKKAAALGTAVASDTAKYSAVGRK